MSYQTSSKRSPPFWLLIGARKTQVFWYQSEARAAETVWNWSGKTMGAIHSTKISGNFGPKLNGSVRSNRTSFEKTGPPFEVDHFSRSDRLEFWLNGSCPPISLETPPPTPGTRHYHDSLLPIIQALILSFIFLSNDFNYNGFNFVIFF